MEHQRGVSIGGWFRRSLVVKVAAGLVAMSLVVLLSNAVVFWQVQQQQSDSTVINIAGRQRMLSQRMANQILQVVEGNPAAVDELTVTVEEFDQAMTSLIDGDATLGVPPAPQAVRPQLLLVNDIWQPIHRDIGEVLAISAAVMTARELTTSLGESSDELLTRSETAVAGLELAGAGNGAVNRASRQSMLSQHIAKFALQIGNGQVEVAPQLATTAHEFSTTLQTLLISYNRQELVAVQKVWEPFHADIQQLLAVAPTYAKAYEIANRVAINSDRLLQESATAALLFEQEVQAKVTRMLWLLATFVGIFLVVFAIVMWMLRRSMQPLTDMVTSISTLASRDLADLGQALRRVAAGDLTAPFALTAQPIEITSVDEIGRMGQAYNAMVAEFQAAAEAYSQSMQNLRALLVNVRESAETVTNTGIQLAAAAEQSGQATQQIATTIGQVAQGNSQLSENVDHVRGVFTEQDRAITHIAEGASKQAQALVEANQILRQRLATAIQHVAQTAQESDRSVGDSERVTKSSAASIVKTINGMRSIAAATAQVEQRVTEMDKRSQEIGAIVQTINEIAERTNLLALNAAIEAARAGEHGKGFAVVADEVRKLAEQASRSTGQIDKLIAGVQATAKQALDATRASSGEVNQGLTAAGETETSLQQIQAAVAHVGKQVAELAQSVTEMTGGSTQMQHIMEQGAIIAESNNDAAEQLAANSEQVMRSVSEVSAISEENSAAAEEVSAAAEEVNAQVEEVVASTNELTEMSQRLLALVERFQLGEQAEHTEETVQISEETYPHKVPALSPDLPVQIMHHPGVALISNGHSNGKGSL